MRLLSLVRGALTAALVCVACLAVPNAQQSDADAAARWAAATVVHYHMVGVYEGATVVAYREPAGTATVTDRVELDLDWAPKSNTVIGEATIVNAPSVVGDLRNTARTCPPPFLDGPYEHLTLTAVRGTSGGLELNGTRAFPAARVVTGCQGVEEPISVPAWTQAIVERMVVPSPLLLAAPAGSDANLTVSDDKRSFSLKNGPWTWTFTPTIVR